MDWVVANWQLALIVVVYVLVNVAPRPHPDEQSGAMRYLWLILDRFSLLTAKQLPGKVKWLLAASPTLDESPPIKDTKKPTGRDPSP